MKPPSRNLATHVPDDVRENLRKLAAESKMTLTQYTSSILQDAATKGIVFRIRPEPTAASL